MTFMLIEQWQGTREEWRGSNYRIDLYLYVALARAVKYQLIVLVPRYSYLGPVKKEQP